MVVVVVVVDCSPIWQPQSTGQRSCPTSVAHVANASTASALLGQYTLSTRPSGQADSKGVFIVAAVDAVETVETVIVVVEVFVFVVVVVVAVMVVTVVVVGGDGDGDVGDGDVGANVQSL